VERASSSDAFGLLGLPAQFDLDPSVIEKAFHDKSKDLHPDRFASAPAAERVVALVRSTTPTRR
jgi:molecular chaperone HscB